MTFLKENAALAAAIFSFTAVVISVLFTFFASRRSIYISSVTAERSKWIEKLRSNLSDYVGTCAALQRYNTGFAVMENPDKKSELNRDAARIRALISLQLNPNDESGIDRNLIIQMGRLLSLTGDIKKYAVEEAKFIRHCQFLLKEEWEKVKSEAKGGIRYHLSREPRALIKRKNEYRAFYFSQLKGH